MEWGCLYKLFTEIQILGSSAKRNTRMHRYETELELTRRDVNTELSIRVERERERAKEEA